MQSDASPGFLAALPAEELLDVVQRFGGLAACSICWATRRVITEFFRIS
jgi:hypothetical protein